MKHYSLNDVSTPSGAQEALDDLHETIEDGERRLNSLAGNQGQIFSILSRMIDLLPASEAQQRLAKELQDIRRNFQ